MFLNLVPVFPQGLVSVLQGFYELGVLSCPSELGQVSVNAYPSPVGGWWLQLREEVPSWWPRFRTEGSRDRDGQVRRPSLLLAGPWRQ